MGSDVAVQQEGQVPALRGDSARTLTAEDISFPRLYIGQAISNAVQDGLVAIGDIFVATDGDDPDPQVIAEDGDEDGVLFHVLDLRKGISRTTDDGGLETWAYDDELAPKPGKATGAWVSYMYFLAIPDVDEDVPVRFLLSRSGQPAARKINTVLLRLNEAGEAHYNQAFRLTTAERMNREKKRYRVPRIRPVEPTEQSLEVATKLYSLVQQNQQKVDEASGQSEGPAI